MIECQINTYKNLKKHKTMNTSPLKSVIIKEVVIVVICLLLGLAGTAFAGGEGGEEEKSKKALAKAQVELFDELDAEYQENLANILEELEHPQTAFDSVEVYNYGGELLKTISLNGKELNEEELPAHAHLLTIDDRTAVYIVFED